MYWVLGVKVPEGRRLALVGDQPDLSDLDLGWFGGARFDVEIPEPLTFRLDPGAGDFIPDFFKPPIPLMSTAMLKALEGAGVDNIDSYQASLSDDEGNPLAEDFRAVNIVGRISCADLEASDCEVDDPDDPMGVYFDSLVIDEERAGGALLFRLHEAVSAVIVHDTVKQALEAANLRGVVLIKPENWVG